MLVHSIVLLRPQPRPALRDCRPELACPSPPRSAWPTHALCSHDSPRIERTSTCAADVVFQHGLGRVCAAAARRQRRSSPASPRRGQEAPLTSPRSPPVLAYSPTRHPPPFRSRHPVLLVLVRLLHSPRSLCPSVVSLLVPTRPTAVSRAGLYGRRRWRWWQQRRRRWQSAVGGSECGAGGREPHKVLPRPHTARTRRPSGSGHRTGGGNETHHRNTQQAHEEQPRAARRAGRGVGHTHTHTRTQAPYTADRRSDAAHAEARFR